MRLSQNKKNEAAFFLSNNIKYSFFAYLIVKYGVCIKFHFSAYFMKSKLIVLIICLMLSATHVFVVSANSDQLFNFRTLTTPQYEHLNNAITCIAQDKRVGFIWAGSRKGLFCYNGFQYREVTTVNRALASALRLDITHLCFDKRGWLWIGTYKGILVYKPSEDRIIEIDNSIRLQNVIVRDLFATASGDVLIGSRNHLFAYKSDESAIREVTPNVRKDKTDITPYFFYSFCEGKDSTIWLTSSYGLLNYDNRKIDYTKFKFYPYLKTFGTDVIAKQQILIERAPDGKLLLGSDKGLYILDAEKKTISPYIYTINTPYRNIRALTFDNKNRLWIGTLNGILITENFQKPIVLTYDPKKANSLLDDRIATLFLDRNNTMWVGTNYTGLSFWNANNNLFIHIDDQGTEGLPYKTVSCISKDKKGNLYFGTEKGSVAILKPNAKQFEIISGLRDNVSLGINSLFVDDNNMWLATISNGLVYFNTVTAKSKRYLLDESEVQTDLSFINNILTVVPISEKELLVGSFHRGLNVFNIATGKFTSVPLQAFKSPQRIVPAVQKIVIDKQGDIWVLAQDDVFRLRRISSTNRFEVVQIFNGNVEDGWINDMCVTQNNALWFTGQKGFIYKYSNGLLLKVKLGRNIEILSIVESLNKNLWLSTSAGVVFFNTKTFNRRIFDDKAGLKKNEFIVRAGGVSNDGTIFFGGASGLTKFYPSDFFNHGNDTLTTHITNLQVYNQEIVAGDSSGVLKNPIAYTDHITLSHKQNVFTLSFASGDFSFTGPNKFEYRLLGFSNDWIRTASSKVTYTLQSGGDYTFQVRNVNAFGKPSPQIKQLHITLLNPWWKTGWAYSLYLIIIAGIGWWLFNMYRVKTKLKYQLQIDALEHEKQIELNEQKLRFFTNISHDFRTPLTLIIGTIEQFVKKFPLTSEMNQMLVSAQKNSGQLMSLINDLMDLRKLENNQTRLSVSERDIVSFAKEIFYSFDNQSRSQKIKYEFKSEADQLMVYFDAQKIERVIYNLLSNAFKFTETGGEISMYIKQNSNEVELAVKDTGCGISQEHITHIFDRFFEVRKPKSGFINSSGIGLTIVKNFVELHKGNVKVESRLNYGSTFTISLPLGNEHFASTDIVGLQPEVESFNLMQQTFTEDENKRIKAIVDDVLLKKDKKYSILIAEDDEDLGAFLKDALSDYFNVRLELNGLKAYQSALNNPPNLIISDVMMPVMNGIEFCNKIKANTETGNNPIEILTSNSTVGTRIEGLESGADDYLSKPFQLSELLLRCANILQTQENFRQNFLHDTQTETNDNKKAKDDDYSKVLKILNSNIDNDTFGINDLCQEMGMSRSVMYSKVKEWTNQSPGELLLGFRMKRAAILLEQQKYSVA